MSRGFAGEIKGRLNPQIVARPPGMAERIDELSDDRLTSRPPGAITVGELSGWLRTALRKPDDLFGIRYFWGYHG